MLKKILKTKLVSLLFSNNIIKKFVLRNSTIILVYHSISHRPSKFHKLYNLNVDPKLFEKQIIWLKKNFNLISPKELDTDEYEKPAVMITFDDGDKSYINNETIIETPPKVNNKKYDDKEKQINEILENEVLPAVRMDGGNIIIIEFKNGVLKLGMKGACNGCPSASITLKEGIHATLEKYLPGEIKKITSVNV